MIGGPGLQSYEMDWIRDPDTGARPRRVVAHPYNMVGNDDDEQGIIQVTCSIVAERQYLVEIVPEKPAAAPALAVAA